MTKTSWHLIAEKWPLLQTLKTSSGQASDGLPRGKSDPATASLINLSIVVLEAEILDMIQRHCALVRKRGGKAANLGGLLKELYPIGAPNPERQAWESFGADFLEEIQQLLKEKPRPWTKHKLDLIAEYPDRFNLTQAQTLIVCAGLDIPLKQSTLSRRISRGQLTTNQGRINLADVLNEPVRQYTTHP